MPKLTRLYSTTTINANHTTVAVRQVIHKRDPRVPPKIGYIAMAAKRWLAHSIKHLGRTKQPETASRQNIITAYEYCFKRPWSDSAAKNTVLSVLKQIHSSLSTSYGIKVRKDLDNPVAGAYVTKYYRPYQPQIVDGVIQYDSYDRPISFRGEIHLKNELVLNYPTHATRCLIHEAGHKFANLRDFGRSGYFWSNHSTYVQQGLTWKKALENADSYAGFAYKVMEATHKAELEDLGDLGLPSTDS